MLSSCCFLLSLISLVWLMFVECSTCRRRARRKQHGSRQQGESSIQTSATQPPATYHSTPTAHPAESVLSPSPPPPRSTSRSLYYQATLHQPIGQNYDLRSLSASRRHNYGATAVAEPIPYASTGI